MNLPVFLSLGAGVQSSALALMAAHKDVRPMPQAAIFADTGWEPRQVYEYLDWLKSVLPYPVHVVQHHGLPLREHALKSKGIRDVKMHMPLPLFTLLDGKGGMTRRQCTRDWKIRPIERKVKRLMGHKKGSRLPTSPVIEQWMGISIDEAARAKDSRESWKVHRFPLLDLAMHRDDCKGWIREHGYPEPPKSACIGCPFHGPEEWWKIRQDPEAWADAVEFDEAIREAEGLQGQFFLHSDRKPLPEAVTEPTAKAQHRQLWLAECEGMCGI